MKFSAEFSELSLFFKATGKGKKMAKTKRVRKNVNRRRSEVKGQETDQDSTGSPKRGFFLIMCS